jgi:hypothetical protein
LRRREASARSQNLSRRWQRRARAIGRQSDGQSGATGAPVSVAGAETSTSEGDRPG